MDDQRIVIPDIIALLLGEDKDVIDTFATEANDNRGHSYLIPFYYS
jgi:hypothetical protein